MRIVFQFDEERVRIPRALFTRRAYRDYLPAMVSTRLTAHSGCLGTPLNSLPYIDAALASPVEFVEVDVRLDSQGELVLSHDVITRRSPGLLTLASVWSRVADAGLAFNLDVKEVAVLEPLAWFLETRVSEPTPVVTGCDAGWVALWANLAPRVPVLLNVLVGPGPEESFETWEARIVAEALACRAAGLNIDHRLVTASLVQRARLAALSIEVWTVNEVVDLTRCLALGLDGLTTDRPDRAHALLTPF